MHSGAPSRAQDVSVECCTSASCRRNVRISSKRFVTSRMIAPIPMTWPDGSFSGMIVNSIEIVVPSLRRAGTEKLVPLAVAGTRPFPSVSVALPMTRSQALGDDQIERSPNSFVGGKAENAFSARIPHANNPVAVGCNYCVRSAG